MAESFSRAQRQIIATVMESAREEGFVIAGGAAMLVSGFSHRPTEDLDAFSATCTDVATAAERVTSDLRAGGAHVDVEQSTESFARLIVSTGERRRTTFRVELGRDHQLFAAVPSPLGPVLSLREMAANKILAAFNRHQPRDLVDLHALATVTPMDKAFLDAEQKDPGFDRAVFNEMVTRTAGIRVDRWPPGINLEVVRSFVTSVLLDPDRAQSSRVANAEERLTEPPVPGNG